MKRPHLTIVLLFASLFCQTTALADKNGLPDIIEVQKAALDYARIRPDELSDLKMRTRRAALLPRFQIGAKRTIQNNVNVAISDNVSVTSSGTNIGPESSNIKQTNDNDLAIEVKAVWNLNEIIYNRDMLDVAEEARYQMRERRVLISEVNRLYFSLEKLFMEIETAKKDPLRVGELPFLDLRKSELTADLDALTGGWFSNRME